MKKIEFESFVIGFRKSLVEFSSWLPITLAVGLCFGLGTWLLTHPALTRPLAENAISNTDRYNFLTWVVVCFSIVLALYGIGYRRLRRDLDVGFHTFAKNINRYAVIVCIAPIFLYTRTDDLGLNYPFFSMAAALAIGLIGAYVTYQLAGMKRWWAFFERRQFRYVPFIIVALLSLSYAAALSYFEMVHHQHLGTRDWDFGLYINTLWNSVRGDFLKCSLIPGGSHIDRHFDPILVLISPILLICNKAETLIVFQAACVGSGAIPLYLLAKHRLGNPLYGIALSLVYLFHPAIHGQNMYDFHSIVLAGPVLLWCMYCLESERIKTYYALFALLLIIREDTAALAGLMAFYLIISGKLNRVAWVTILISAAYALFANKVVMSSTHPYDFYFEGIKLKGHSPAASIIISIFTNPGFVLRYAFAEERVLYILKLFMPIMALPLFSKKHYILYVWGLGMTLFGSWLGFVNLGHQYSVYWLPFMLASVPHALDNISSGRLVSVFNIHPTRIKAALTVGMVLCAISMSSLYGVFWPSSAFRAGWEEFQRYNTEENKARYETVKKIEAMVPDDAAVLASRRLGAHFSLREHIWSFAKKQKSDQIPDFVLIWSKDLKMKKDRKVQDGKVDYYKKRRDYKRVLDENDIQVYKQNPTEAP